MKVKDLCDSHQFTIPEKIKIYEEALSYYKEAKNGVDPLAVFGPNGVGACALLKSISKARLSVRQSKLTPFPEYLASSIMPVDATFYFSRHSFDERIDAFQHAIELCKTR